MLNEREDVYRVLLLWQKEGFFIKESGLPPFAMELALGVCRRHLYLLYFIKENTKKMPTLEVQIILEMGLFQMFFMDVPDYASINSSVEIARKLNLGDGSIRLVNAFLRNARRNGCPKIPLQRVKRVSIENSVPEWIVRRWFDSYGADCAETMAKETLERPSEWIRANLQKISAVDLSKKLGLLNALILYERYIEIPSDISVKSLLLTKEFSKGYFSFQNPSAFDVVELLNVKPGMLIWDACAAPGGKSALIAEMDSSVEIIASDSSENRIKKINDLKNRLELTNVKTYCVDIVDKLSVNNFISTFKNEIKFDRILLDVPCSNMGVISRRPESIYRITPEIIKELAKLQYNILESAAKWLNPNGRLVYATCSPDSVETTQIINRFIKEHPEFVKVGDALFPKKNNSQLDNFFAQALEYKK